MQKTTTLALIVMLVAATASAQLIVPRSAAPELLIPAAGSVQGFGNTFFRSDITLINYRATNQFVRLRWLPEGEPSSTDSRNITINASTGIISEDFVTTILGKSGLGAILVTAINLDGTPDPNGRLFATSRIWTPQPGSEGTVSQTFPTIATSDVPSADRVAIIGQRRDDRYRLNVGIVNLDVTRTQTFIITVATNTTENTTSVTVPALSLRQTALIGQASPTIQVTVENVTPSTHARFVAYGSSVDNTTGDSWSSLGFVPSSQ